ncbi:RidA family protein [Micromonospora humi]|uniref:Enamine deaminase RidA, house cleaning of reactive enamine intermediates, YjgF/YER057c/UK114 family n=1 Tax=Micromonospora humi TaxID=745366 RepID=A0A1C5JNE9_9ACTN|nr:RidA family protein [Micromonospora humi]SCG71729.1 Enamine deaminase RidA, house cleaning of reactive enamine intermediates, YjgF/YER057c/UK114 family [Micromonospora humi]
MPVTRLSPDDLQPHTPYHHVAVATGSRHIHVSGQIARLGDGTPVATGDLTGQVAQVLRNTGRALAGADASFDDVVRLTFYVTDWAPEKIGPFMAGIESVAEELGLPRPLPPASLIGVDHLFEPDVLVELEATAVTA